MKQTSRQIAVMALGAFRKNNAWSDGYLKKAIRSAELTPRDAALTATLTYGVLQNMALCDFYISSFSSILLKKISPRILDILRIGVYQLVFLDRIPAHAAVNESVQMARRDNPRAAGFVNAILRKIIANLTNLPEPIGTQGEILSIKYSHPEWLVKRLIKIFGINDAERILSENNCAPSITARVNPLKGTVNDAIASLEAQNVSANAHEWLCDCITLSQTGDIEKLKAYQDGLINICDPASQMAALTCGTSMGDNVMDACAAPGGKSFVLAQMMNNKGKLLACDIHAHKLTLIARGAMRQGISIIETVQADASVYDAKKDSLFDVVLADVPCSGLGIIRKKPEIRYKEEKSISQLPQIQGSILHNVSHYVKPGGILVYSTCTILPCENEKVVTAFLDEHNNFELVPFDLPCPSGKSNGMLTLLPHIHGTDGFFISKLRRKS